MQDWIERWIERAENVLYVLLAAVLLVIAAAVLVRAVIGLGSLVTGDVSGVAIEILDLLLLVFIVVELLFAVRATIARRELVAEPFLLVGIIAAIKEIVVLAVKAPDALGTEEFEDIALLIGLLAGAILVLAVASYLLRRKEREPTEAANSGHGADEGNGPGEEGSAKEHEKDESEREHEAAAEG